VPPAAAAALLAGDRAGAERLVRAAFDPEWPLPDILDVFPAHAVATDVDGLFGVWAIVEIAAGSVIGDIGFLGPQDATGAIEVGYSIVPGRRRRGYASEAAAALVSWAFERLGVPAIVAGTDSDNVASHRMLERLGFVRTDTTHDELRWRLERGRTAR
jgi:ribosomal-protein-alanine N-acetyltransferase